MRNLKEASSREIIKTSDFINLPEVHCQRNTTNRVRKVVQILQEKPSIRHLEVAVGEYPDGKRVIIDGNTRALAWKHYSDSVKVPTDIIATVYEIANDDEAVTLYQTFDSPDAVENSKDKHYSALRMVLGDEYFYNSIVSDKLKKGLIATGVKYAIRFCLDETTGKRVRYSARDINQQVRYLRHYVEELKTLDRIIAKGETNSWQGIKNQSNLAAALLILKKYGAHNYKAIAAVEKLLSSDIMSDNQHTQSNKIDAIACLNRNASSHPWYGQFFQGSNTQADFMEERLNLTLWSIDLYMSGKFLVRFQKNIRSLVDGYYKTYAAKNEFASIKA